MPTQKARIVTTLKPGVNHIVEQLGGGSGKDADIPLSSIVSTLVEEALEHRGLFTRPEKGPNSAMGGLSLRLTQLAQQKGMTSSQSATNPVIAAAEKAGLSVQRVSQPGSTEPFNPLRTQDTAPPPQRSISDEIDSETVAMMSEVMAETMSKFIEKRQAARSRQAEYA